MNMWKTGAALVMASLLASCGGGGGAAGDVASFNAIPSAFTWSTSCPGGVAGAVSIHTVNGGQEPFRVRVVVEGLEVGFASDTNTFVQPQPSDFSNGDLILRGQDPKFAVRATLPCPSDVSVTVLDTFSRTASVSIKVEELN